MRNLGISIFLLALTTSVVLSEPQGFMSNIRNFFTGGSRPNRPPQQQPQQQQFRPQQQQQFRPEQNRFVPPPQPQQNFQPQQNNFAPQQQFQQRPQSSPSSFSQQPTSFQSQPSSSSSFNTCAEKEPSHFCPQAPPNHFYNGKGYLLTFNISCSNCECSKFTQEEADDYCKSMGARPVSLDTPDKLKEFFKVSADYALRYYWTGCRIQYPSETMECANGNRFPIREKGVHPWSPTGGWVVDPVTKQGRPQPDNRNQLRDNCEPEFCIGVLNNFYADGIKFHDVACHHRKPTICEWP